MNLLWELRRRFERALEPVTKDPATLAGLVKPTQDARFGDFQANCAMPLAKELGLAPRAVAERIVAGLDVADLCLPPEIAGPGFINLTLRARIGLKRRPAGSSRTTALASSRPPIPKSC